MPSHYKQEDEYEDWGMGRRGMIDAELVRSGTILKTVVGSEVHGIALPGRDDRDEMAIYIEPL